MYASYVGVKSLRITGYTLSSFLYGRQVHSNAELLNNCTKVENKNPRNMELLRIARKPVGYQLEKPGRNYWHKLQLSKTGRHVTAEVIHFQNGPVVSASTIEWSIKKQLYRLKDASAYQNIGQILARRCLESGIYFMRCDIRSSDGDKIKLFLKEIKRNGITLQEHKCYHNPQPWSSDRPEKPWAVVE
ncbi:39S ribosomal protein L18, mitochondrial [Cephus cinctus]|uniref:Large ribosomal subunit protein uL18m n=1 Tax=Cephus cinctus TaxID=211228 RepID=A0AAJ7FTQ8_CEPCN|nr:39S ribosomal protein L18, mitochondrial [Cephus cinctus]XP_024946873.1 39S ribosomal protein L18, mitochondrial [Cephus cinctus]